MFPFLENSNLPLRRTASILFLLLAFHSKAVMPEPLSVSDSCSHSEEMLGSDVEWEFEILEGDLETPDFPVRVADDTMPTLVKDKSFAAPINDGEKSTGSHNPNVIVTPYRRPEEFEPLIENGWWVADRPFAAGGMGMVFLARRPGRDGTQPGDWVTLKYEKGDQERLVFEADGAIRVQHEEPRLIARDRKTPGPWIPVAVLGRRIFMNARAIKIRSKVKKDRANPESTPDQFLLLMPLYPRSRKEPNVPAPSLQDRIDDPEDPVLADQAKRTKIIQQVVIGIGRMHESGLYEKGKKVPGSTVIHGDIKPANIPVDDEGDLTILDFGLVTIDGRHWLNSKLGSGDKARKKFRGTPEFMSREALAGEDPTEDSDLWAGRKTLFLLMAHGKNIAHLKYDRRFDLNSFISDFKFSPEELNPERPWLITAMWAPHIKTSAKWREAIENAATMGELEFYDWMVGELKKAEDPAIDILGSEFMLKHFPRGFTEVQRDAIFRRAFKMEAQTKNARDIRRLRTLENNYLYYHYDKLRALIGQLHAEGLAKAAEYYETENPPTKPEGP